LRYVTVNLTATSESNYSPKFMIVDHSELEAERSIVGWSCFILPCYCFWK